MTDTALEPCPLCGDKDACVIESGERFYIACGNIDCFLTLGEVWEAQDTPNHAFSSPDEAIAAWNRRVSTTPADVRAQSALRGWLQWYRWATADDDNEYLNNRGWDDAEALASTTMAYLADPAFSLPAAPDGEVERLKAELSEYRKRDKEQRDRIRKLEGAVAANPPIGLDAGEWFYPEGDTSSEDCRFSPGEVVEYYAEGAGEGESFVVAIDRAVQLPEVYAAVHVFTEAEKDKRNDDEPWCFTLHAKYDEALAALPAAPKEQG